MLFHRVLAESDPLFPGEIDRQRFSEICSNLKSWCNVLSLPEAVLRLKNASLPPRATCITFDDGYSDNFAHALPVLKEHGLHATFFVATGFLDGGRMWNDTLIESVRTGGCDSLDLSDLGLPILEIGSLENKRRALSTLIPAVKHLQPHAREEVVREIAIRCKLVDGTTDLMMTSEEVQQLRAAGMEVGAHTVSHPILARCDDATAKREIEAGRSRLETLLDERIRFFAYPNGKLGTDYTPKHADMAREIGFEAAVTTNPGASFHGSDIYQLSRFTPWDRGAEKFGLRLALNTRKKPVA